MRLWRLLDKELFLLGSDTRRRQVLYNYHSNIYVSSSAPSASNLCIARTLSRRMGSTGAIGQKNV